MADLFLNIFNMSISASWLVLAVVILRFFMKKAPKWTVVLLWGIVALRLVFPFSIESALSLIPSAETIPPEVLTRPSFSVQTGIPPVDNQVNEYFGSHYFEGVTVPANNSFDVISTLAAVWVIGVAALVVYTMISYFILRRKMSTAVLLRDNIYQSEKVGSPFVLGLVSPKIYLPFGLDEQTANHVIAHENAHISRRDHWWKPIGFALLAVYWFNPIMWLAYILLCRDIELACDEKVIKELGNDERADYSEALLSCSVSRRSIAACPIAFGQVGVKERVKSVLNYKKPAFWVIVLAVAACVAVAVCFLTDPKNDKAPTDAFEVFYNENGSGIKTKDGEIVVGAIYDSITVHYNYFALELNGKIELYSVEGNYAPGGPFDSYEEKYMVDGDTFFHIYKDGREQICIMNNGEFLFPASSFFPTVADKLYIEYGVDEFEPTAYSVYLRSDSPEEDLLIAESIIPFANSDFYDPVVMLDTSTALIGYRYIYSEGDTEAKPLSLPFGYIFSADVSPNGEKIAYYAKDENNTDIVVSVYDIADGEIQNIKILAPENYKGITEMSPTLDWGDSETLYFDSPISGKPTVEKYDFRTKTFTTVAEDAKQAFVSDDGKVVSWIECDAYVGGGEQEPMTVIKTASKTQKFEGYSAVKYAPDAIYRVDYINSKIYKLDYSNLEVISFKEVEGSIIGAGIKNGVLTYTVASDSGEVTLKYFEEQTAVGVNCYEENGGITAKFHLPDGSIPGIHFELPEGLSAAPKEGYVLSIYEKSGEVIGTLSIYPFGTSDPEVLGEMTEETSKALPMQVYSTVALSNHAEYDAYARVKSEGNWMAAATARYLWQDLTDYAGNAPEAPWLVNECVLAYDWSVTTYFAEFKFEEKSLTLSQRQDIAASLYFIADSNSVTEEIHPTSGFETFTGENGKLGLKNPGGETVIEPEYDEIEIHSNFFALVKHIGDWYPPDKEYELYSPEGNFAPGGPYSGYRCRSASDDIASISLGKDYNLYSCYLSAGEFHVELEKMGQDPESMAFGYSIFSQYSTLPNPLRGIRRTGGQLIVPCKYSFINIPLEDRAYCTLGISASQGLDCGKAEIYDLSQNRVINTSYNFVKVFAFGRDYLGLAYAAGENGEEKVYLPNGDPTPEGWYIIDKNGNPVVEGTYRNIYTEDSDTIWHDTKIKSQNTKIYCVRYDGTVEEYRAKDLFGNKKTPLFSWDNPAAESGTFLNSEQMDQIQKWLVSTVVDRNGSVSTTPISCFFTSEYTDPRDIAAEPFIYYCPYEYILGEDDKEEYILAKKAESKLNGVEFDEEKVQLGWPCRRLSRKYLNSILMEYAGITVEEMNTDWTKTAVYVEETDCFYSFATDFGYGTFNITYGTVNGSTVRLWETPDPYDNKAHILVLEKTGGKWFVKAHYLPGA